MGAIMTQTLTRLAGVAGLLLLATAPQSGAVTYQPLDAMGGMVGVRGGDFDLNIGKYAAVPQTLNGSFTTYVNGELEIGLRASLRYDDSADPGVAQPVTNYDGGHTYTFSGTAGNAPVGQAVWNFDWWINTAYFDPTLQQPPPYYSPDNLSDFYFLLTVTDPAGHVDTRSPFLNLFGSALAQGATQKISSSLAYGSENPGSSAYSPPVWGDITGTYTVALTVFSRDCVTNVFGMTTCSQGPAIHTLSIAVNTVPLPAGLPALGGAFGLLTLLRHRRRTA